MHIVTVNEQDETAPVAVPPTGLAALMNEAPAAEPSDEPPAAEPSEEAPAA